MKSFGWDTYARFYDWENARTMGRRDLAFWKRFVATGGRGLELGCGTGRLLVPLARAGARLVGVDLSSQMLARAHDRALRIPRSRRPGLIQGDMRRLPLSDRSFRVVFAPYGVLQSVESDTDFASVLEESARVLRRGGRFGMELVPDLARWQTYTREVRFRGTVGRDRVTLIESVRQNARRSLTIFDEEFTVQKRGGRVTRHRFSLTFRTRSMEDMLAQVSRAGLHVYAVQGDYRGGAWTCDADTWIVLAQKR